MYLGRVSDANRKYQWAPTMKLSKPSRVEEFIRPYTPPVVLDGAVSTGKVDGDVGFGCPGIE